MDHNLNGILKGSTVSTFRYSSIRTQLKLDLIDHNDS